MGLSWWRSGKSCGGEFQNRREIPPTAVGRTGLLKAPRGGARARQRRKCLRRLRQRKRESTARRSVTQAFRPGLNCVAPTALIVRQREDQEKGAGRRPAVRNLETAATGWWPTLSRDLHSWFHNSRHYRANHTIRPLFRFLPQPLRVPHPSPAFGGKGGMGLSWWRSGKSCGGEFQIGNLKFKRKCRSLDCARDDRFKGGRRKKAERKEPAPRTPSGRGRRAGCPSFLRVNRRYKGNGNFKLEI